VRWRKVVAWIAIPVVAVGVVAWVGVSSFSSDKLCGNDKLAELPSPDGAFKAVVFERDCGATSGFSTQVSVLRREAVLGNTGGNVFVEDSDHGRAPTGSGGGPEAKVVWIGNREMRIDHHVKARVFVARALVDGVAVTYSTFQ
jgi:hypothetical protein